MNSIRMKLRARTVDDTDLLIEWYKQKELMKHVGYENGLHLLGAQEEKRINNQKNNERLLMLTLLDDTAIGECSYFDIKNTSCKIHIKICDLNFQGKGYGKEGLQMLLAHLFGVLGIKIVFVDVLKENKRAQHLFGAVGFEETGLQEKSWIDQQGIKRDIVLMTLTLDVFKKALNVPFKIM